MKPILLFILLVIIAVVVAVIITQSRVELGSRAEDILLEQARVAELKAELEMVEAREREELAALRLEMTILEKENTKNVITFEKELIASGLKGKEAEDALRKELEETRLTKQAKVDAIQSQLDKTKIEEQARVKSIQSELDKSQARIGLMEANVEKLKNKPIAEIVDLKEKLSEANLFTKDLQNTMEKKTTESSEAIKELEEEIAYLKSQAAAVNKSPDIEKKKISIQSDEDRANAMDSQDIVENDEKKNSGNTPRSSSGRVITKGRESLEMSPAMREKLQTARYKAENNEKNNDLKKGIGDARHTGPRPSIYLEKLGPPSNMMQPAVCRDIPGSAVDSCGRPSKLFEIEKAAKAKAAAKKAAGEAAEAAAQKKAAEAAAQKKAADRAKIAAEAAAQKKAADKAKIVAIAAAVKKAMAIKEERERIAAEKAEAERIAAAQKKAAEEAARVNYRSNSGSGSSYATYTNVKLNDTIAEIGDAGPSQLGGQFFAMIGRSTAERDYRTARNIVVR